MTDGSCDFKIKIQISYIFPKHALFQRAVSLYLCASLHLSEKISFDKLFDVKKDN